MEGSFENSKVIESVAADFAKKVERALQDAVKREGLVASGDLLRSVRAGAVTRGKGFIQANVRYMDLLRIKDIRVLTYFTIPPIRPLMDWVERKGVDAFAYVPGYPEGKEPKSEIEAIERIARGIQYNLKAKPNFQRGYRSIYNDTLYRDLLPEFIETMKAAALAYAGEQFSEAFGYDTTINLPDDGDLNAGRIQAAWNARDTRLSRRETKK